MRVSLTQVEKRLIQHQFMETQNQLMKKMIDCLERKEKKVIVCYKCGKPGHIARNCSRSNVNQGNVNRAGAHQRD